MSANPPIPDLPPPLFGNATAHRFFEQLRIEGSGTLFLDFDGTLAPFATDRDHVQPYAGVREALRKLQRQGTTRLILNSGRSAMQVERLLGLDEPIEVWGVHGWEHLPARRRGQPPQLVLSGELSASAREGLALAIQALREAVPAEQLEFKACSAALHWRGLPAETAAALREHGLRVLPPLATTHGLTLRRFDGGMELLASGRDKGYAVRRVLVQLRESVPVAYLGNDFSDEDGFRALYPRGIGVLVREAPRPSNAAAWLRPPEQLLSFFAAWHAACAGEMQGAWS